MGMVIKIVSSFTPRTHMQHFHTPLLILPAYGTALCVPPAEEVSVDTDSAALAVSADASGLSVLPELPHPVIIIAAAMNSAIHLVFLLIIFLLVFLL